MGLLCYYMPLYPRIEGPPDVIGQPRGGISILRGMRECGRGSLSCAGRKWWTYKTEVEDLEVDLESGQVRALVLPGRRRLFGLLGREEDRYIPWDRVRRFGEDIILVEQEPRPARRRRT